MCDVLLSKYGYEEINYNRLLEVRQGFPIENISSFRKPTFKLFNCLGFSSAPNLLKREGKMKEYGKNCAFRNHVTFLQGLRNT